MATASATSRRTAARRRRPPRAPCPVAPDTTITKAPKKKARKRSTAFEFAANQPGSSFECALDGAGFAACTSPLIRKVKVGKHSFQVRASAGGLVDQTPAVHSWKVKKKRKRR